MKNWLIGKDPDAGKEWRQKKGTREDEMVGWHHQLKGHEFEQAPGADDGRGSLVCCSPWDCRVGHDWGIELAEPIGIHKYMKQIPMPKIIKFSGWVCACVLTRQAPLSTGFSRQEYWSGFPFPTPGGLPDPRIEPISPASPTLADRFFTTEPSGKPFLTKSYFISFQRWGSWGGILK